MRGPFLHSKTSVWLTSSSEIQIKNKPAHLNPSDEFRDGRWKIRYFTPVSIQGPHTFPNTVSSRLFHTTLTIRGVPMLPYHTEMGLIGLIPFKYNWPFVRWMVNSVLFPRSRTFFGLYLPKTKHSDLCVTDSSQNRRRGLRLSKTRQTSGRGRVFSQRKGSLS